MDRAGLDALLLTTPPDVFYVTGFLTRFWESPARPWFVLVPSAGDPVAVIPSIGELLFSTTWVDDIRTWNAPDPNDDGVSLLADAICELVPEHGVLGVPMGLETHLRMPLADLDTLLSRIAPRALGDATAAVQHVREVKSEGEVSAIRESCRIAGVAFDRVPEFAGSGCPLDDVFRAFQIACLQAGADWVSYTAGGAGQGGYGDVIAPATQVPLRQGDVLMLDTGLVRAGYFCDFDRNYSIGPPDDDVRRAHAALHKATDAALAGLRPGHTASELHTLMAGSLVADGATPCGGRLGHGLGLSLTEWPSVTPMDRTVLRAGMVLTLEPGVQIAPGRILVHEEVIVLRDSGPELLSPRAPTDLPVLD
ncbi:aminopeptidase P family protein (plasmid) [Rhodobacteraceae bacterium SC52]|nr:aminopeptidase P family protein [Rhodobacteraceae bacterium SC52]